MYDPDAKIDINHHQTKMAKSPRETIEELREQNVDLLHRIAKCECGATSQTGSGAVNGSLRGSSDGLERLHDKQEVAGSNPVPGATQPEQPFDSLDPYGELVTW